MTTEGHSLSHPYIIWTMRRTGGTTLATLLATLSEHAGIQHEPFNDDRMFGHISRDYMQTGDAAALRRALRSNLARRPLIKHCYELTSPNFNRVFLKITTELGYRHIILDRQNETDRIVSLELAQLTGAWGGADARQIYPAIEAGEVNLAPLDLERSLRQMRLCRARRQGLFSMARAAGVSPFVVFFEDVYNDPDAGRVLVERLLAFLDINPSDNAKYDALVTTALIKSGQNSARILEAVPGAQGVIAQLEAEHSTQTPVFARS